jgi:hypothetical protein
MCAILHEIELMPYWEASELRYKLLELTVSLFQSQNHITKISGLIMCSTFCCLYAMLVNIHWSSLYCV